VTATHFFTRLLPAAAVAAGLLVAVPVAGASERSVKASIALGDKRAKYAAAKTKPKAKKKAKKVRARSTAACANTDVMPTAENLKAVQAALLCLHNQIRSERGLPQLKSNAKLAKAALRHSTEMVDQGFFDHTSPDGDTFVDRILRAGYVKRNAGWSLGENLAWGTGELSTAASIMRSWMNSPGHKANILKRGYREIGIGIRLGVPSDDEVGATVTAAFGARL
jgi:uncharacterized protein YkwD